MTLRLYPNTTALEVKDDREKEPELIVPAWEQKKKSKVKSFDLHPDIPMSERLNFDLANNQVEEVNKKSVSTATMRRLRS